MGRLGTIADIIEGRAVYGDDLEPTEPPTVDNVEPEPVTGEATSPFIDIAVQQAGDKYQWGHGRGNEDDPSSFDCSGLIYFAARKVGVKVGGTAYEQWRQAESMSVEEALRTPGALLFVGDGTGTGRGAITHVAISLGDGRTIEARGKAFGVVTVDAATNARRFDFAGRIPQLVGGSATVKERPSGDRLLDRFSAIDSILKGNVPRKQQVADTAPTTSMEPVASGAEGKAAYQSYARSKLGELGWDDQEYAALDILWGQLESGWDPNAKNRHSTAYGIGQLLDRTWAGTGIQKTSDPYRQIDAALVYIRNRYGSPSAALAFHRRKGFY